MTVSKSRGLESKESEYVLCWVAWVGAPKPAILLETVGVADVSGKGAFCFFYVCYIPVSMVLGFSDVFLILPEYTLLLYRANSKTPAWQFHWMCCRAVRSWNLVTSSFLQCPALLSQGLHNRVGGGGGTAFSLTVRVTCSLVSQSFVQILLQMESLSLIVTGEGRCPVLFPVAFQDERTREYGRQGTDSLCSIAWSPSLLCGKIHASFGRELFGWWVLCWEKRGLEP